MIISANKAKHSLFIISLERQLIKIIVDASKRSQVLKPLVVRYIRLFCAAAVLTVAGAEVWANVGDAEALGLGSLGGAVATVIAKKFALIA